MVYFTSLLMHEIIRQNEKCSANCIILRIDGTSGMRGLIIKRRIVWKIRKEERRREYTNN